MINTKDLLIETNFTNRDIKSFEFINWSNESFFLLKRLNWKKHKEVDATVERDGTIRFSKQRDRLSRRAIQSVIHRVVGAPCRKHPRPQKNIWIVSEDSEE